MRSISALPDIMVELDGSPLQSEDTRTLGELRIHQRLSLPTLCELTFFDPPGPLGSASLDAAGLSLRVTMQGHPGYLFIGEVTAVEYSYGPSHENLVRIRGYDLLHRLRKRQQVRAHIHVTLVDLIRDFVGDYGIPVEAMERGPVWMRLIQQDQSDLDFLREVAERCGLYFILRDGVLHIVSLEGTGEEIQLVLGESLFEARIEVNGDPACRFVSTTGWDPWRIEQHQGDTETARVGRNILAQVPPDRFSVTGKRMLVDEAVQDDSQARAVAQAELDFNVGREVILWGVAEADPRLQPGTPVRIQGVAPYLAGRYILTAVNHCIDSQKGFISEISTAPPVRRQRSKGAIGALGVVTQIDDPENRGRVQVSLPAYNDVETDWMSVLTAGAGVHKGLVMLPDVGDQVLVLFTQGDPAQGVVLGGLYGSQKPPDWGIEGGAVKRYTFQTPGGQRLQLDDANNSMRLENSQGSYIELAPGKVRLHSKTDLDLEAPGHSVVVRGKSIDFERA